MKENRLLNILGQVDEEYIAEAVPGGRKKRSLAWLRWVAAAAACFGLVVYGRVLMKPVGDTTGSVGPSTVAPKIENEGNLVDSEEESAEEVPSIVADLPGESTSEREGEAMGFEAVMCYSADELENGNPWRENMELETLPVFKNGSYDPSGASVPVGLSEQEMMEIAAESALTLRVEILSTDSTEDKVVGNTDSGKLTVFADGTLMYEPAETIELPEEYRIAFDDATEPEAKAVMEYLAEQYATILDYKNPVIAMSGDYSFSGDYTRRCRIYDAGESVVESMLNYWFNYGQFLLDDDGKLWMIRIFDALCKAETIGDYPLISLREARDKLLNGQYETNVPMAVQGEEYIAKVELCYRPGSMEEYLLPYYRFYVELQDMDEEQMTFANGLKTYGIYYVPAIRGGAGTVLSSTIDDGKEFRLVCSDPAGGLMEKRLEEKQDGQDWKLVEDLSGVVPNYPQAMIFLDEKTGIILTDYHGDRNYVFMTQDGGRSWTGEYLGDETDLYTNGIDLSYDRDNGLLWITVSAKVSDDEYEERGYISRDHGRSWSRSE